MIDTAAEFVVRRERVFVVLFLLFAALLRVPVILHNPLPSGDGAASNVEVAVNLDSGYGFSTMRKWILYDDSMSDLRPEGNRQPAMALLLLATFGLTGSGFLQAQLLSLLLGSMCLLVCWWWARRLFGIIPALFTLLVLSITPLFIWYSTQPDSLMLFTAVFFAVLTISDRESIGFGRAAAIGLLTGVSYLVRTQGLILAGSMGLWIIYRASPRRLLKTATFAGIFIVTCLPWFLRNNAAFGSPTHTQGSQFLINENHWSAWAVRETPPGPLDMLRYQGPVAVASYAAKGVLRVLEPFTTGSLHRGEVFGQPTLAGFAILALLVLRKRCRRKRMLLPLVAALPPMMMLALHEHSGRYLAFFVVMVTALGSSGLVHLRRLTDSRTAAAAAVLLLLPFIYPVAAVLGADSRERASEAHEVSDWIASNSDEDEWVVTYPNVEMLIWDYRRPTLTMPNDYQMLVWPCLEEHGVRYVVVDNYLPVLRPHLADRWRRSADGTRWQVIDPPPFLTEVYRSSSGRTIVYEMSSSVPQGFMQVDSLPRDNMRALPPARLPW
jgi:4-amino-4-deoxy-L-arabinose transferase-like glycosyltransferase